MDGSPLLAIRDLHAGYGETEVLRGVDLAVDAGEIVAVLGSNGAGKSTLNVMISGVLRARKGSIRFAGDTIDQENPARIVVARTHSCAGRAPHLSQSERQPKISISGAIGAHAITGGRIASAYSAFSRALPSDNRSLPAPSRAVSSKCWQSAAV